MQSQTMNVNSTVQSNGTSFSPHNQLLNTSAPVQTLGSANLLALAPLQSSMPSYQGAVGTSNVSSFRGYDDVLTEEEIRVRSHEMLANEDMQHLLRIFNMGGYSHGPVNVSENNYHYSDYMPNHSSSFGFEEDRTRSSGKAVVGWLKLKAALRWGIFIRKKAAERRAQIVELDDS